MDVDELKKNLHNVIERYRNKDEFTGEVCRDVMARDCLQVVEELEAENKLLKQEVRCLNVKLSDESNNATILAEKLNEMNHAHKRLRNENAKLKCLALHAMIGYGKWGVYTCHYKYKHAIMYERWSGFTDKVKEAYRKAKQELTNK